MIYIILVKSVRIVGYFLFQVILEGNNENLLVKYGQQTCLNTAH